MQDFIRLLPDALANQIAAGEVVQRPASVVKELMENSIDAGADFIELIIVDSGKGLIQVVDNGKGMSETDARMCFERHATSKLLKTEDLFNIRTMGFRGEAMASIAAVAQVNLKSRPASNELGTEIQIDSSEVKYQEPCAMESGSIISVRNLFYNVPARRNFLKSDSVEMKHIIDEFQHIALAYPEKSFRFTKDNIELYILNPGKLSQRIVDLLGKGFKEQLVSCQSKTDLLSLKGYIGKPESSKKTRGDQFLFVNKRFIKSSYLNHAITTAFESLIPEKHTPFYALFLEMEPSMLDINVHPTKTEIKFEDERTIYAIVRSAVKQALGSHNIYPTLDFEADVNLMKQYQPGTNIKEQKYSSFRGNENRSNRDHWVNLFDENMHARGGKTEEIIRKEEISSLSNTEKFTSQQEQTFTSKLNEVPASKPDRMTQLIQIDNHYILAPLKQNLMIVDQRAALERIIFEKLKNRDSEKQSLTQRLLFPATVELNVADIALLDDIREELLHLGFEFETFGKNSIVINGIPADIAVENEKDLFETLIEQYKNSKNDLNINVSEKLMQTMAKRSAAGQLKKLDLREMEELINRLFTCSNMNYSPNGKPTFKLIERTTIENFFK